jgi:nucleotide-binding universal stress UspA family protein
VAGGQASARVLMYRKLVVGYRADRHGDDVIALARLLASAKSAEEVLIVEVLGDSEDLERRLAPMTEGWPPHVKVSVQVGTKSSPAEALRSIAAEQAADLVVLGSTHRGFMGRVLHGTTADRVTSEGWTVAVAPLSFSGATPPRTIGVAFDGSEGARAALAWAVDLASQFSAGIRLVAVVEPPPPPVETWGASVPGEVWSDGVSLTQIAELTDTIRGRMRSELDAAGASVRQVVTETAISEGDAVQELRAEAANLDVLVVGSHEHGRLAGAMGSVSRGLAHSCPAPLALVPAKKTVESGASRERGHDPRVSQAPPQPT